ncbi:hypothetical protein ZIOFF_044340 [Zingiber officinale]|uniref:DUF7699 domain-containing protein n=1 Tax=Zingiber officinale TaxID=94328 RepID=A0A8J5FWJ9_ZINOF|nr:hypothetical protein ZIOFF_044340 [Zingiber officinale]
MVHYLLDSSVRRKRGARMRRSHRTAASSKTRGVDVVPICSSSDQEGLGLKDGNGEILYPWSSFFINCTGDVCKGDVVRFRQRVYDKFTRRTIIGKRTIAGRVVKESYGAAKQQHTFTVEVLWSRGKNALPPMFPLLVKGRNLYRLKTFRQKIWRVLDVYLGSRHHQGSSFDAKLNGKKRRGEQSRDISGRKKKKVAASSRKVPCENTSSQAHTDTVARNFDPSYNVPRQAINNGGSRPYKGISSDANKQANWTRNASLHNVPHASTSRSAHLNVQDAMTRSFHPSYNNRRQGINHGGSTYRQHPVSLRNAFYDHNTRLELLHPTAAPPPTNPGIAYAPTHRRDGSFGMTRASHLPSNMRYQFNHPYASVASSVDPWTESQHWQRP